jgi:hypothetical protein
MSMSPIGPLGSIAGSQLAQSKGSESDRVSQESSRQTSTDRAAEKASGAGGLEEEQAASDRDADGRRIQEEQEEAGSGDAPEQTDAERAAEQRKSRDATGQRGKNLDLSG